MWYSFHLYFTSYGEFIKRTTYKLCTYDIYISTISDVSQRFFVHTVTYTTNFLGETVMCQVALWENADGHLFNNIPRGYIFFYFRMNKVCLLTFKENLLRVKRKRQPLIKISRKCQERYISLFLGTRILVTRQVYWYENPSR